MKHSILFKLLAILLCAVSLMGVVGGTAGALVLVEGDLYNRTVDQMLEEKLQTDAAVFAEQAALAHASREFGGCPEDMLQRYAVPFRYRYGYSILDTDGIVMASFRPELKDNGAVYAFPVTGQYMHLVSTETAAQKLARETAARMESIGRVLEDQNGQTVPTEGIPVNHVIFTDHQGTPIYEAYGDRATCQSTFYYNDANNVRSSSYDQEPQTQIGFLYYGADGQLMYRSFLEENEEFFQPTEVYGLMFLSHENGFLFQTEHSEGMGILTFENGHLNFAGYPVADTVEESLPAETVPETTAETLPPETLEETQSAEETYPEETSVDSDEEETEASEEEWQEEAQEDEEESSSASDVPEEDYEETQEETAPPTTEPPETSPPETMPAETVPAETVPQETAPLLINGKPLETYQVNRTEYYDSTTGQQTTAKYVYLALPSLTVEVYVDRDSIGNTQLYNVLRMVRQYRSYLLPVIGVCLLLFVLSAIYLCTAAGRSPRTEVVRAGGLNRIPLDLYLGIGLFLGAGFAALAMAGVPVLLESDFLLGCSLAVAAAFTCCLLFIGFCYAFVSQAKTPGGLWWRNLLCIRFVFLSMAFLKRLEVWLRDTAFPWLVWLLGRIWELIVRLVLRAYHIWEKIANRLTATMGRWFSLLPLTWQWVVCGMALFCLLLIACNTHNELLTLICLAASFAMILYGSHCFGTLLESTRKMGQGDLNTKVDDRLMAGSFKEFAGDLNSLADVAMVAAQKQLKSERMKTELITNVSHDIKTPLTSIINYVDLLQKPHTEEQGQEYLEVLDRQSQRLKKLVDDLMDMSKASTGNMSVEITRVDAVESVNQALGEFSDKLSQARLYPVFRHTEDCVPMMADGKLVWRVLSNLLSNAVKYGMPGTRIYLDLAHVNGKVIISLKNISREELNVSADELMERFVRGDVSRNTEGSGLGLNIAKSLMELQKGHLQILVDGDLFKVTLIFPDA